MPSYFLGVDIGNTKSHALIANEAGQALALAVAGPGNHEAIGVDGFTRILHSVVDKALMIAGISKSDIAGAGYGVAGYDWPSDRPLMEQVIATLDIPAPYEVVNDAVPGLVAGTHEGWGVSISAGTSSNCRGRDRNGREGRVTGNGMTFGEYGGGTELVYLALHAVSRAWSLRGPETRLSSIFVAHHGAKDVEDFLEGLVRGRYFIRSTDAPLVFEAAAQGDRVALDLILFIARELGNLAIGVIRQLEFENREFEVVLAGSFYKGSPLIETTIRETVQAVAPGAQIVRLEAPPVVGAVMLGMEATGVDFVPLRYTMISTAALLEDQQRA